MTNRQLAHEGFCVLPVAVPLVTIARLLKTFADVFSDDSRVSEL
jgi:hypothetical protein